MVVVEVSECMLNNVVKWAVEGTSGAGGGEGGGQHSCLQRGAAQRDVCTSRGTRVSANINIHTHTHTHKHKQAAGGFVVIHTTSARLGLVA